MSEESNQVPSFGIVVYDESTRADFLKTLRSIKNINYDKKNFGTVLSIRSVVAHSRGEKVQDYIDIAQMMRDQGFWFRLSIHSYDDQKLRETECFQKIGVANYIASINTGQEIHPNTFNIIIEASQKIEKIMVFDDTKRDIAFLHKATASDEYYNYKDYNNMVEELRKKAQKDGLYSSI